MRIHVEKLSRLNVASIIVMADNLPQQNHIQVKGSSLKVNDEEVAFKGLEFQENSLTVQRNATDESIWFRTPLASSGGLKTGNGETVHIVQNEDTRLDLVINRSALNTTKPKVEIGNCYEISCTNCKTQLARLSVERVLPLPSSDWNQLASNWFCCSTRKHVQKGLDTAKLNARKGDLIYGSANFLISKLITSENTMKLDENLGRCLTCSAELGMLSDESVFLWYYAVQISSTQDPQHFYLSPLINSPRDNLSVILESKLADTSEKMPWIKLTTLGRNNSECLKVWILDKDLTCYTYDNSSTLNQTQQRLVKLAFKKQTDNSILSQGCQDSAKEQGNVATMGQSEMEIEVSEVMYNEAKLMFLESCQGFPESCKIVAGMQVAYVPLH